MLEEFHNKTKYWKKLRTHSYEKLHYMGEITLVRNLFNAANVTCLHKKKKLTVHIRTHNGMIPYQFNQFDMAITHQASLTVHLRTHTG